MQVSIWGQQAPLGRWFRTISTGKKKIKQIYLEYNYLETTIQQPPKATVLDGVPSSGRQTPPVPLGSPQSPRSRECLVLRGKGITATHGEEKPWLWKARANCLANTVLVNGERKRRGEGRTQRGLEPLQLRALFCPQAILTLLCSWEETG